MSILQTYIRRVLFLPLLALISSNVLAEKPGDVASSPEFQKLGKLLLDADAANDHWNTYRYALELNEMMPGDDFISFAITALYKSVDFSKAETTPNAGISEKWAMRCAQCPEPGKEADGMTHLQYSMVQTCLACYIGNLEHDFDATMHLSAKARKHLNLTKAKDMKLYKTALKGGDPEAMLAKIEKTARSNKSIATVGKVATWIRKAMTQSSTDSGAATADRPNPQEKTAEKTSVEKTKPSVKPQFSRYAGTSQQFKVTSLGNIGGVKNLPLSATGGWVTVYDSSQDRKLSFNYGEKLGTTEGDTITVTFNADGKPITLKNNRTGKSAEIQDAY